MGNTKDTRTAHQKWEQGISEARLRGYWQVCNWPSGWPPGLFQGWDHTKQNTRDSDKPGVIPEIRSRGKIPPNCKDDTDNEFEFTVTTCLGIRMDVDQTETRRLIVRHELPPKEIKERTKLELQQFSAVLQAKKEAMLPNINHVAGPHWEEWCAWDDEYLLERCENLVDQVGNRYQYQDYLSSRDV